MSDSLRDKAIGYLRDHHVMTLATSGREGVWAAAVFYASVDFSIYFLSSPQARHSRNLETQSTVAATIQEDYRDWLQIKGIQLEGTASRIEGDERALARSRYEQKFPVVGADAPPEIARALSRIAWYKLVPERLYFIDNALGLGHRDEVLAPGTLRNAGQAEVQT